MRLLLLLMAFALLGCPSPDDDDSADDDDATGDDDDAADPIQLPDPNDGDESDGAWQPDRDISTPETAWPAGSINTSPFYVEATVPAGDVAAWYVFEADADFDFDLTLYDGDAVIESVHVHSGAGLVLGEELTADVDIVDPGGFQEVSIAFPAYAAEVYVLEFRVPGAGFF